MNTVYLSTIELKGILQAILVGITSEEGLKFNRAFLVLRDDDGEQLVGRHAIGPDGREEAGRVWQSIKQNNLHLSDIISHLQSNGLAGDIKVNSIVHQLRIPLADHDHVLISACIERRSIVVSHGQAEGCIVPEDLLRLLDNDSFLVVPLYSPSISLGVIIVDNYITRKPITIDDIHALEIFASQASLAIEHSHLYEDMRDKIRELEFVTQELEKSKDLLVAAEKYSAIGHMSAQLVHVIRNPITSIGGTARLLAKKTDDDYVANFLSIITKEASRIESTLEDLFSFVEDKELQFAPHPLYTLIRRSVMVFYPAMKNGGIIYTLDLPGESPTVMVDGVKIRQVFMHLVKNAIEAMPQGGELEVSCRREPEAIWVSVTDNGAGISDTTIQHVTDPFFTTKTYGTGMGLTLVEKIAAMHGASFHLSHHEGGGMIASLRLPTSLLTPKQRDDTAS